MYNSFTPIEFCTVFMGESSEGPMLEEGQNHPKNPHKRIKVEEITDKRDDDGISALPDCLLVEILSRLPSTKDAIRTGTLSKRWEHLWTLVPSLIFTLPYQPFSENPNLMSDFALFVDKTLSQCRQLKLKKFEVGTIQDSCFESQFNNWIRFAISCNVEELHLDFRYAEREADFRLDQSNFFINSCFTDLSIRCCALNPSGAISWKSLRSLCISAEDFDEDLIVNILSGSPLLENFELGYRYIFNYEHDEPEAPNSLSLPTQWPQLNHLNKFKVSCICDIRFQSHIDSWIRYAIRCNVKNICLSFWIAQGSELVFTVDQVIFTSSCFTDLRLEWCVINPVGAISWKNLRSLHISDGCLDEVMIENILSGSPVLETLELEKCCGYRRLDITSKSVKNLVLSGYYGSFADNLETTSAIEINAPNILSLTIQHEMILRKLLFVNVSSLVKAKLNYRCTIMWYHRKTTPREEEQKILKDYIQNLGHVKELEIGDLCSEALSCLRAEGFLFSSNVKFPDPA